MQARPPAHHLKSSTEANLNNGLTNAQQIWFSALSEQKYICHISKRSINPIEAFSPNVSNPRKSVLRRIMNGVLRAAGRLFGPWGLDFLKSSLEAHAGPEIIRYTWAAKNRRFNSGRLCCISGRPDGQKLSNGRPSGPRLCN